MTNPFVNRVKAHYNIHKILSQDHFCKILGFIIDHVTTFARVVVDLLVVVEGVDMDGEVIIFSLLSILYAMKVKAP
jgi:hypothetical protein